MNLYQEHILDHYHNPKNWGNLQEATHHSDVTNPTCGDTLHFELVVEKEHVNAIAWTGEGCAISLASASLLSELVPNKTVAELLNLTPADILQLVELSLSPGRLKCAILSLEGLHKALQNHS